MVFEFLKKKLQEAVPRPDGRAAPGSEADYEERRKRAQELQAEGKTSEAVTLLDALAADLAGAGNFALAVAVRHQIHQWRPDLDASQTPDDDGLKMATQRAESGIFKVPALLDKKPYTSISEVVKASPFLENLTAPEIGGLIASTGLATYASGRAVVEEGTPGDRLYIVTRGVLSVTTAGADGRRVRVGSLTVGDFFGEIALLTGKPRAATVTADTNAECLQINAENWQDLSARHPRLKQLLEEAMVARAANAAEAVIDDMRKQRGEER